MSPTPLEVISLYEKYEELKNSAATTLQRQELDTQLGRDLQCIEWEVEVSDVTNFFGGDFALKGRVSVPKTEGFWAKRHRSERCRQAVDAAVRGDNFTAYFSEVDGNLRNRFLALKPGQLVKIEGPVTSCFGCFTMNPARLVG